MRFIDKIMLDVFITCLCDRDFTALGNSEEERLQTWSTIKDEYADAVNDTASEQIEALQDEILYWDAQILVIQTAVRSLRLWRDEKNIQMLRDKGYAFSFSETDVEAYNKDLDRVVKQIRSIETAQENRKHELQTLVGDAPEKDVTREDFINNIVVFSKFQGYAIDEKTTTVSKYIAIRNMYHMHVERMANENVKHG